MPGKRIALGWVAKRFKKEASKPKPNKAKLRRLKKRYLKLRVKEIGKLIQFVKREQRAFRRPIQERIMRLPEIESVRPLPKIMLADMQFEKAIKKLKKRKSQLEERVEKMGREKQRKASGKR